MPTAVICPVVRTAGDCERRHSGPAMTVSGQKRQICSVSAMSASPPISTTGYSIASSAIAITPEGISEHLLPGNQKKPRSRLAGAKQRTQTICKLTPKLAGMLRRPDGLGATVLLVQSI